LVGSEEEIEGKKQLLKRLSNLAYSKGEKTDTERKRTSRFFFVVPSEFAVENKNKVGNESLPQDPFNAELESRLNLYQDTIGKPVLGNSEIVREFILRKITPLLIGLDVGVDGARTIIHSTVADVDNYPFLTLELLTREAVKMKLADFVCSYFGLQKKEAEVLIAKIAPTRPLVINEYQDAKKDKGR
jgi:hypothetical protein